jgi:hypothetical protein
MWISCRKSVAETRQSAEPLTNALFLMNFFVSRRRRLQSGRTGNSWHLFCCEIAGTVRTSTRNDGDMPLICRAPAPVGRNPGTTYAGHVLQQHDESESGVCDEYAADHADDLFRTGNAVGGAATVSIIARTDARLLVRCDAASGCGPGRQAHPLQGCR